MMHIIAIVLGLYIIIDAIYLASQAHDNDRWCHIARYAAALMCGGYLLGEPVTDVRLLFASAIALFMWPDTWYRLVNWLEINNQRIYILYVRHFGQPWRRRVDK
jgi:hypothetical protein